MGLHCGRSRCRITGGDCVRYGAVATMDECAAAATAWWKSSFPSVPQHAWLSSLPPEGASAIVHRDTSHGAQMARAVEYELATLRSVPGAERLAGRAERFRRLGSAL